MFNDMSDYATTTQLERIRDNGGDALIVVWCARRGGPSSIAKGIYDSTEWNWPGT